MIVIFSGPSGAGKSTVIKELLARHENFEIMPTMTTRAPRPGESEGNPYYFVTKEKFETLIAADGFYEYQPVHNNYYGTNKQVLRARLNDGKVLLKDIDVLGTMALKNRTDIPSEIVTVYFTLNPETLKARLINRGDDIDDIALRLSRIEREESFMNMYDLVVENINLTETVNKVDNFIYERLKAEKES